MKSGETQTDNRSKQKMGDLEPAAKDDINLASAPQLSVEEVLEGQVRALREEARQAALESALQDFREGLRDYTGRFDEFWANIEPELAGIHDRLQPLEPLQEIVANYDKYLAEWISYRKADRVLARRALSMNAVDTAENLLHKHYAATKPIVRQIEKDTGKTEFTKLYWGSEADPELLQRLAESERRELLQKVEGGLGQERARFLALKSLLDESASECYERTGEEGRQCRSFLSQIAAVFKSGIGDTLSFFSQENTSELIRRVYIFRDTLQDPEQVRDKNGLPHKRMQEALKEASRAETRVAQEFIKSPQALALRYAQSLIEGKDNKDLADKIKDLGLERCIALLASFRGKAREAEQLIDALSTRLSGTQGVKAPELPPQNQPEETLAGLTAPPIDVDQAEFNELLLEDRGFPAGEVRRKIAAEFSYHEIEFGFSELSELTQQQIVAIVSVNPEILRKDFSRLTFVKSVRNILNNSQDLHGYLIFDPVKFPNHFSDPEVLQRTLRALEILTGVIKEVIAQNINTDEDQKTRRSESAKRIEEKKGLRQVLQDLDECGFDGRAVLAVMRCGFYRGGIHFIGNNRFNPDFVLQNVARWVENYNAEHGRLQKAFRKLSGTDAINSTGNRGGVSLNGAISGSSKTEIALRSAVHWVIEHPPKEKFKL